MKIQQEKISKLREIITALHNSSDEPDWEAVFKELAILLSIDIQALFKGDEESLTNKELLEAWENAFETPVYLDHKPTLDELLAMRLRAVVAKALEFLKGEDK